MPNRKTALILFIALVLILPGCLNQKDPNKSGQYGEMVPASKTEQPDTKLYSVAEISEHNNESDCWLLITGRVYDVTEFIARHPGGKAILQGCGQEASQLFNTRPMGSGTDHSTRAKNLLDNYYIGNLKSNEN